MPIYIAPTTAAVALTASTTKTIVQVATPSTRRLRVKEWGISFDGTDATKAPILVQLVTASTSGTSTSVTPVAAVAADPAALCSAGYNFTVEPTFGSILWQEGITPAGGFDRVQLPLGEEFTIAVSSWVGLRCVTPSAAVNATAYIRFEE